MKPLNLTKVLAYALSAVTCTALLAALPTSAMAQSRSASPTLASAPVRDSVGVDANPFIRVVPESSAPLECSGDYSLKLDIDKNIILPGEDAVITLTLKGTNIQPKPMSIGCLTSWFRLRAQNTFSNKYGGAPSDPFVFITVDCVAPNLPGKSCLQQPNPAAPKLKPLGAMIGWPIGSWAMFSTLYLNYGEERIYKISMKRTAGNTKTWETSKTQPTSGAFKYLSANISSNTVSYFVDTNPINNSDVIFFKEWTVPPAPLVPIKLAGKGLVNLSDLQGLYISFRADNPSLYSNILVNPNVDHTVSVQIKPLANNKFIYNTSLFVLNFGTYSLQMSGNAGSLNAPTAIDFKVPANAISNSINYFNISLDFSSFNKAEVTSDLEVTISVKTSFDLMGKIVYKDIVSYAPKVMQVGASIQTPSKWTWIDNTSFKWDSVITVKNFTPFAFSSVNDSQMGHTCTASNGDNVPIIVSQTPLFNLTSNQTKNFSHTFTAKINSIQKPTNCSIKFGVGYIGANICTEKTKASTCYATLYEQAVSGNNPDANGNGDPTDDADSYTISAP